MSLSPNTQSHCFSLAPTGERYIGLGSGDIGIVEATDNPQILTTRKL